MQLLTPAIPRTSLVEGHFATAAAQMYSVGPSVVLDGFDRSSIRLMNCPFAESGGRLISASKIKNFLLRSAG